MCSLISSRSRSHLCVARPSPNAFGPESILDLALALEISSSNNYNIEVRNTKKAGNELCAHLLSNSPR